MLKLSDDNRAQWEDLFAIDYRALAVFRLIVGGVILLKAGYAIQMCFGTAASVADLAQVGDWCLIATAALCLMVGRLTLPAVVVAWVLLCRHFATMDNIGTYLTIVALMWSLFLPLDRCLTWRKRQQPLPAKRHVSFATAAILIQIFFIYVSCGVTKDLHEWVHRGDALYHLMHTSYGSALGQSLVENPLLLRFLSIATIFMEIVLPFLLFIPGNSLALRRNIVAFSWMAAHLTMAVLMTLDAIPLMCVGLWVLFVPTTTWDRIWQLRTEAHTHVETTGSVRNLLSAPVMAIVMLSAVLSWYWPHDESGRLQAVQERIPRIGLYQQWRMFNTPSVLRAQQDARG